MSEYLPDFLYGLQMCGGAFGLVLVAVLPLPFLIRFGRWAYAKKDHSERSDPVSHIGACEGDIFNFNVREIRELDRERF